MSTPLSKSPSFWLILLRLHSRGSMMAITSWSTTQGWRMSLLPLLYRFSCIRENGPHFESMNSLVTLLSCFKNNPLCMSTKTMPSTHVCMMSRTYGMSPSMHIVASPLISYNKCLAQTRFFPFHNMTLKLNSRRVTIQHEIDPIACLILTRYISAWWST